MSGGRAGPDDVDGPSFYDLRKDVRSGFYTAEFGKQVKHWNQAMNLAHVYPKDRIRRLLTKAKKYWKDYRFKDMIRKALKSFIEWLFLVDPQAEIVRYTQYEESQNLTGKYRVSLPYANFVTADFPNI